MFNPLLGRLVWQLLPSYHHGLSAIFWQDLHLLQHQIYLHYRFGHIWGWVRNLRRRYKLNYVGMHFISPLPGVNRDEFMYFWLRLMTIQIVGRAVAGLGASALFSGGMTIVGFTVPLVRRPIFIALLSSMVSSISYPSQLRARTLI